MSKTTIEIETAALDENTSRSFHYHLDHFIRQITGIGVEHTVTHSPTSVVVDDTPLHTKGSEHAASATPTHTKPK